MTHTHGEAGSRLERAIREAMARSGLTTVSALSRRSRVTRASLYSWFRGDAVPSPDGMTQVADALEVPVADLWAAYQGRKLSPTSMEMTLLDHAAAMREQTAAINRLLDVLTSGAVAARAMEGSRR